MADASSLLGYQQDQANALLGAAKGLSAASNALTPQATGTNYGATKVVTTGDTWSSSMQDFVDTIMSAVTDTKTTTGSTKVKTDSSTQNTTDPSVVAFMKNLMGQAAENANNPKQTEGVVTGITNTLRDAMTTSFGKQNQAGLYGSSSQALIGNDLISRASADAAQAVLSYKLSEQNLAASTASELGKLLSSSKTSGLQTTDTSQIVTDNQFNISNERKRLDTQSSTRTNQTTGTDNWTIYPRSGPSNTQQGLQAASAVMSLAGGAAATVVCTWMHKNGLLSTARYAVTSADFVKKPLWQIDGYHIVGTRIVDYLEKTSGKTLLAKAIIKVFWARTNYICAANGYKKAKKTFGGWLSRALLVTICLLPALYCLLREVLCFRDLPVEGDF